MRFFASIAASVGLSPTEPDTAVTTQSLCGRVAASISPSMPETTRIGVSATAVLNCLAAASSYTATSAGLKRRVCSSRRSICRPAVSAATGSPRCAAAASVCRPIDPVLPRTEME